MPPKRKRNFSALSNDKTIPPLSHSKLKLPPVSETKPSDPNVLKQAHDADLRKLSDTISDFLSSSSSSSFSLLPPVSLLSSIRQAIESTPVRHLLSLVPKIPHLLLLAARRGWSGNRGAHELASILVSLSRLNTSSETHQSPRAMFRRSNSEAEVSRRVAQWALGILVVVVRGEEDGGVGHGICEEFPRDSLEKAMEAEYVKKVIGRLEATKKLGWDEAQRLIREVCDRVREVAHNDAFIGIIDAVLMAAKKLRTPVEIAQLGKDKSEHPLDDAFVDCVVGKNGNGKLFLKLSEESRIALLSVSERAWTQRMRAIKSKFEKGEAETYAIEKLFVQDISKVAAEDVEKHWELMDNVRRAVGGECEPFSVRSWKERRFYRAVLKEVGRRVWDIKKSATDGTTSRQVAELSRRFPLEYRSLVQGVYMLSGAPVAHDGQGELVGLKGLKMVCDMLKLQESVDISENAHSVLVCIEGMLEKLCWAAGFEVGKGGVREWELDWICLVCAVVEVIRLPGGMWAESKQVVWSRVQVLKDVLKLIKAQGVLRRERQGQWLISGLFAMTVCGCATSREVRAQDFDKFDNEEKRDMRRGVECAFDLCSEIHERQRLRRFAHYFV